MTGRGGDAIARLRRACADLFVAQGSCEEPQRSGSPRLRLVEQDETLPAASVFVIPLCVGAARELAWLGPALDARVVAARSWTGPPGPSESPEAVRLFGIGEDPEAGGARTRGIVLVAGEQTHDAYLELATDDHAERFPDARVCALSAGRGVALPGVPNVFRSGRDMLLDAVRASLPRSYEPALTHVVYDVLGIGS